jgi:DHA2 family multidrug resistance protein-like MFS transporter
LLDTARVAFTQGMHTTAVTGAVVMTVSAVLVVILLRHVQVGAGTRPAAPEDTTHSKAAAVTP